MTDSYDLGWLISVDDHVLEPPHVWSDRLPAKYREIGPRMIRDDRGEAWVYEDARVPTSGLSAAAGKKKEDLSPKRITYDEMRPGCYDPVARLEDMDRAGVLASLCFPSFPRFCGQVFLEASDKALALLCVQAYNDWMIDEWCGSAPGRFIPQIIVPLWDPRGAALEIERCAGRGARALCFSESPSKLGLPTIHDRDGYWEPMFAAAADCEVVVCMHIGSSSYTNVMSPDSPVLSSSVWGAPAMVSGTMCDWLLSSVFQRHPALKIALSEGGIGWMPYFLERAEQIVATHRHWATKASNEALDLHDFDVRAVFRDHIFGCFIVDEHGVANIDAIGIDNVMIETDYPHSDSTWPDCIEVAQKQLAGLSDADAYKVLRGNAERVFRFTPATPPVSS